MPEQLANNLGSFEYANLFAGGVQNVVTDSIKLKAGQVYLRGTVVSLDTDGKAVAVDSASAVESVKKPYGILTDNVDATGSDVETTVYLTGEFNRDALIFGGTDTYGTHQATLREMGIFLKKTLDA